MPVIAMWKCDRDGSMFEDKKAADAHDKMLELAEQFTSLLESQIEGIDEVKAESFGLLLSKNKDLIVQACKGKPEILEQVGKVNEADQDTDEIDTQKVSNISEAVA